MIRTLKSLSPISVLTCNEDVKVSLQKMTFTIEDKHFIKQL